MSHSSRGQLKVSLEEYETRSRTFAGYIGENTPITFNSSVHSMSPAHRDAYSVVGWYHYDQYRIKIPLVGISSGALSLYHFEDDLRVDTVLNFLYDEDYNFWEAMDRYTEMDAFDEKIAFAYEGYEEGTGTGTLLHGWWTNGKKRLPIKVYENDVDVLHRHSVLEIEHDRGGFHVDLAELNVPPYGNSVHSYKNVDGKIRVLLCYQRYSKPYALGMCGAGEETGFIWLEFDESGCLLAVEDFLMTSCLLSLDAEQTYEDEVELTHLIMGKEGGDQFLRLDKATLMLEWEDAG